MRRVIVFMPGHQAAKASPGHVFRIVGAKLHAVAQNRNALGDFQHLVQAVAYEHYGDAATLQFSGNRQQRVDLVAGQRGRRFVHNHQPGVGCQRAADRHQLPLRNR